MIIQIPGSSLRKTVKVEFLLPDKIRDGEGMNIRYIKSEIEKIAVKEGGATTLKAPVEGLVGPGRDMQTGVGQLHQLFHRY